MREMIRSVRPAADYYGRALAKLFSHSPEDYLGISAVQLRRTFQQLPDEG